MKNYIANIITGSRILFSFPLLFIPLSSAWFYALYLFCGFSDMIDGAIARKTGAVSEFGARLDSACDFVFMLVCSIRILPLLPIPIWLWVWIAAIAIIKISGIMWGFIRRKSLLSIHSVLNKATGFALFLLPLTLTFAPTTYSVAAVSVLATIAVVQEVCFVAKGREVV